MVTVVTPVTLVTHSNARCAHFVTVVTPSHAYLGTTELLLLISIYILVSIKGGSI